MNRTKSKVVTSNYGMHKVNTDADDESWITINGTHVSVNGEGEITKGPGSLKALGTKGKKTSSSASGKGGNGQQSSLKSLKGKLNSLKEQHGSLTEGIGGRAVSMLRKEIEKDPHLPDDWKQSLLDEIDSQTKKSTNSKEYGPGTGNGNIPSDATSVNLKNVGNVNIEGSAKDKVWGTVYEGKDENGNTITFSEDGHLLWDDGGINTWKKEMGEEELAVNKATYKAYSSEEKSS